MISFPPTIILRHRKENLRKCTLRGLETRPDFLFFTYPHDCLPPLSEYVLLTLEAPPLSLEDQNSGIFLIDGTWNYAAKMEKQLAKPHLFQCRSLPSWISTAYPRKQTGCVDPHRGLASIEALVAAYAVLGRPIERLLDQFHWKEAFMERNPSLFLTA